MSKQGFEGPEKRKYVRLAPGSPIRVHYRVVSEKKAEQANKVSGRKSPVKGQTRNVSGGGIFLEAGKVSAKTLEGLLLGKKILDMRIDLPGVGHQLQALAQVMWVEPEREADHVGYGMGVKFVSIQSDDQEKLMDYVIGQHIAGEVE